MTINKSTVKDNKETGNKPMGNANKILEGSDALKAIKEIKDVSNIKNDKKEKKANAIVPNDKIDKMTKSPNASQYGATKPENSSKAVNGVMAENSIQDKKNDLTIKKVDNGKNDDNDLKPKGKPGRPKKEGEPLKPTTVKLPPSVLEDLQELASLGGTSFTSLVADICQAYVAGNQDILKDFRKTKEKLTLRMSTAAKVGQNG